MGDFFYWYSPSAMWRAKWKHWLAIVLCLHSSCWFFSFSQYLGVVIAYFLRSSCRAKLCVQIGCLILRMNESVRWFQLNVWMCEVAWCVYGSLSISLNDHGKCELKVIWRAVAMKNHAIRNYQESRIRFIWRKKRALSALILLICWNVCMMLSVKWEAIWS